MLRAWSALLLLALLTACSGPDEDASTPSSSTEAAAAPTGTASSTSDPEQSPERGGRGSSQALTAGDAAIDVPTTWRVVTSSDVDRMCLEGLFHSGAVVYLAGGPPRTECTGQHRHRIRAVSEPGIYAFALSGRESSVRHELVGYGQPFGDQLSHTEVNGFEAVTATRDIQPDKTLTYLGVEELNVAFIVTRDHRDSIQPILSTLRAPSDDAAPKQ